MIGWATKQEVGHLGVKRVERKDSVRLNAIVLVEVDAEV
jgi:hypothetical protein